MADHPYTYLFFGRSGAGKGTQAKMLVEHLKNNRENTTLYIETGQLFREFIKENTTHTRDLVSDTLSKGGLLPAFLPIWIWGDYLINNYTGTEHLVFDGVCRRIEEAPIINETLKYYNRTEPRIVYIDASREWCTERLLERQRSDDTKEDIARRLDWYEENVVPVIEFFKNAQGVRFISINGEQSIEDVHREVLDKTAN